MAMQPEIPEPANPPKPPTRRPLRAWETVVDRKIREAQERGAFTDLPGAGKPLQVESWDPEWGMAHHVLKNAGETLPWLGHRQDLIAQRAALDEWLADTATRLSRDRGRPDWKARRSAARIAYLKRAAELDRLLLDFSILTPTIQLELPRLPTRIAEETFDGACPA